MELTGVMEAISASSPISLLIAVAAVTVAIVYFALGSRGLPPGPTGVPILGYWPFLDSKTGHEQLDALKKKYGDVYSFTCTGTLYIHLGTAKAVREAHLTKSDCFGSRKSDFSLFSYYFKDGVGLCNGEPSKVFRKYFTQNLRDRGLNSIKDSMSGSSLYDSMNATVEYLRSKNGEPQDIVRLLTEKCNYNLRLTLFGDVGITSEELLEIGELYGGLTECITPANMFLSGNIGRILFRLLPSTRASTKYLEPLERAIYKIIDDHKSSYSEELSRDIIDDYLKERNLRKSKGDPSAQYFTDRALMVSLMQFVGDGVLGVAVFVALFLKIVVENPEEQDKVYEELVEVVGLNRQPTIEDKSKLTYTNAFMLEVLRMSDFFPIAPSQACTKETTLRGYRIPVGAVTVMNSWSAHHDPDVYEEPLKVNPSRYLSKDGGKKAELPITFGTGKRSCLGESYTMMQAFLFLTSLVKNFKLTKSPNPDAMQIDVLNGKMEICAHPRNLK